MQVSVKLTSTEDKLCCGLKECGCHFTVNLADYDRTNNPIYVMAGHGENRPVYFDYEKLGRDVMKNIRKIVEIDA